VVELGFYKSDQLFVANMTALVNTLRTGKVIIR